MKLSIALGIVLAASSSWSATAFAPSALSPPHAHRSGIIASSSSFSRASSSSRLSMVGGGMIERPPGDSSKDDDDDDDDEEGGGGSKSSSGRDGGNDFQGIYLSEKEKFLSKLGRDIDINPWDPNPYIKPRPGKYNWDEQNAATSGGRVRSMQEAQEIMSRMSDDEIVRRGQPMTTSEREENLNVIRRLRQHDVPLLKRSGDIVAMTEAAADANEREKADPWYELNERLSDAIKYETEDPDHVRMLMEKVGGPPPPARQVRVRPPGLREADGDHRHVREQRASRADDRPEAADGRHQRPRGVAEGEH